MFFLGRRNESCLLIFFFLLLLLADSCVWTSLVGRADTRWQKWGLVHENEKDGWRSDFKLHCFQVQLSVGVEESIKPVVHCLEVAVWHWHLNGAETGETQAPASGKGMRGRAWSTGCTGACTLLYLCFSALWSNHQISCVALERWLVGALNSSWF